VVLIRNRLTVVGQYSLSLAVLSVSRSVCVARPTGMNRHTDAVSSIPFIDIRSSLKASLCITEDLCFIGMSNPHTWRESQCP
jgi:hypothetical protein